MSNDEPYTVLPDAEDGGYWVFGPTDWPKFPRYLCGVKAKEIAEAIAVAMNEAYEAGKRSGGDEPTKERNMRQEITEKFKTDENGNPAGGMTEGVGFAIAWQDGPLGRDKDRKQANGAFVEGVLQAAIGRLLFFQGSKFKCRENALAITKLEEALHWLDHRTKDRIDRGVEGTHEI